MLRFYDGICQWEEGSATPVLHIGWAKPLVNTISKFDADVRAQVVIVSDPSCPSDGIGDRTNGNSNNNNNNNNNNDDGYCVPDGTATDDTKNAIIRAIESKVIDNKNGQQSVQQQNLHPSIVALTAACSEKILNPKYLLQGGGPPFVADVLDGDGDTSSAGTSKSVPIPTASGSRPTVILQSHKMRGLKDLLLAEKLNTHAISLQLTAQSQVGKKGRPDNELGLRPKRSRRE